MPEAAAVRGERQFLTFSGQGRRYALDAQEVAEVVRLPALARVPQAPPALLGLGNIRGRVTPVASLAALVGRAPEEAKLGGYALLLEGKASAAVAIESAPTLVSIESDRIRTDEAAVVADAAQHVMGVFAADDGEVARIIDIRALLEVAFVPRARPESVRRQRGASIAAPDGRNDVEDGGKLLTFMVAGQEFALELDVVREVILAPTTIAPVPHSEDLVVGVAAYRDTLLPLLSLRGLLGLADAEANAPARVVVSRVGGALVGLVADGTKSILAVSEAEADPPPPVLAARTGAESQIKAIYRGDAGQRLVSILAPEQLFRDDVMQRLKGTRAADVGADERATEIAQDRFLVFKLGPDEFALPIEAVIEVARIPGQITKVPKTPAFLEGVISFRGDVLPVVDQRRRFDMPVLEDDATRRLIVVRSERHRAALIVDAVSEVLANPRGEMDPAPDLSGHEARLVLGVINLEEAGRMVMVLDPLELLSRAERGILDAFAPDATDTR